MSIIVISNHHSNPPDNSTTTGQTGNKLKTTDIAWSKLVGLYVSFVA